jgi:SAM-dependent methyltransferase
MEGERSAREKAAYDEGGFTAIREKFRHVYRYVYQTPNSLRIKQHWQALVRKALINRRVLEVGCGEGWDCRKFLEWGAAEVHGIDLSSAMLLAARQHESPRLRFFEHDLHQPWPYTYDVIVGRSVLHHLNYRVILEKLYEDNLAPGGEMVFVEPLGEGFLMRLYWRLGNRFHTPDERPFQRDDIRWLRNRFANFRIIPMNYVSLPAAAVTLMLGMPPDNAVTRFADRVDVAVANRFEGMQLRYRSAVFHITKPGASSTPNP